MPDDTDDAELRGKLTKVVARAWLEPAYRQRLASDAKGAFADEGVNLPADVALTVVEDSPEQLNIILGHKPLPAARHKHELGPNANFYDVQAHVYGRALHDHAFRQRLVADPAGVLTSLGADLGDTAVRVYESTERDRYFALPMFPRRTATASNERAAASTLDAGTNPTYVNVTAATMACANVLALQVVAAQTLENVVVDVTAQVASCVQISETVVTTVAVLI